MKAIVPERFERGRLSYERIDPEHAADLKRLMLEPRVLATKPEHMACFSTNLRKSRPRRPDPRRGRC